MIKELEEMLKRHDEKPGCITLLAAAIIALAYWAAFALILMLSWNIMFENVAQVPEINFYQAIAFFCLAYALTRPIVWITRRAK